MLRRVSHFSDLLNKFLGRVTAETINNVTITEPATAATLTIADGVTLSAPSNATVSGTNTGDQTNITGNAATVTTNANLTGPITSSGNATAVASQTGTGTKFVMDTAPTFASTITVTTGASVGGATPGAGGVAFPATAVAVANANTLDDYEEGTWTAAVVGSGTAGTYEILSQYSEYVKIGAKVWLNTYITLAAAITAGGTGNLTITGAPFTKKANHGPCGPCRFSGVDWVAGSNLTAIFNSVTGASTSLIFIETPDNAAATAMAVSGLAANDVISFSIEYVV